MNQPRSPRKAPARVALIPLMLGVVLPGCENIGDILIPCSICADRLLQPIAVDPSADRPRVADWAASDNSEPARSP